MILFRTELSKGNKDVWSQAFELDLLHNFSRVARWVNFSYIPSAPHLRYVVVSPSGVGSVLVAKSSALRITKNENSIVNSFQHTEDTCLLVVELCNFGLLQHVSWNCWVVSIRHYFHPKKYFHQRIRKANANCVDEYITRVLRHSFEARHLKC